jgi:ATP-dependent Zn protease
METRATAFHEAGHIVAAWHFGLKLQYVTIEGGMGSARDYRDPALASDPAACEDEAVTFRVGLIAERMHHGGSPAATARAYDDLQRIKVLASVVDPLDYRPFYRRVALRTRSLLRERERHVIALATALIVRRRIEGRDLQDLLDQTDG